MEKIDISDRIVKILEDVKAKHQLFKYKTYDTIYADMPKKEEKLYHGSSYEFRCRKPIISCEIRGDLIVKRGSENNTKEHLEKLDCKITDIHRHPEDILYQISSPKDQTSHLHFLCKDKGENDTFKILNFIREY